ncbi:hypothetical protein F5Y13DRAFT_193637 [Hypoxylon sp. FL1857]|nr:hypothetical protein F5Y13DRAFT_193637 [Hypoxylon sp. FL1857]
MTSPAKDSASSDALVGAQEPATPVRGAQHEVTAVHSPSTRTESAAPTTELTPLMGDQPVTPIHQRIITPPHVLTPAMRKILLPHGSSSRPTNPTPGNQNNWTVVSSPVTPVEAHVRRLAANAGRVPSSASSESIKRIISPSDGRVFAVEFPDASAPISSGNSAASSSDEMPAAIPEGFVSAVEESPSSLEANASSPTPAPASNTVVISQDLGSAQVISLNNFVQYESTQSESSVDLEQQSLRSGYGTFPQSASQRAASCWDSLHPAQVNALLIVLVFVLVAVGTLAWGLASIVYNH